VGRIANGALIEREVKFSLLKMNTLRLSLRNPDLTTARRVSVAINTFLGVRASRVSDPKTVHLKIPRGYRSNIVNLLTDIEQLRIEPDQVAKVVIDENSGIIVIGSRVRVSEVAIAQGNLTVSVTEEPIPSQPAPFSRGKTVVVPRTTVQVDDENNNKLAVLRRGVSLQKLVDGLNALGVGPRDMIAILQAIKAAGALQAEVETM